MKKKIKMNKPSEMFHLQWHLTERCNLRCRHCYMDEELIKNELSRDAVKDILHQYFGLLKEWGMPRHKTRISFTGGEPFARGDFFDILEECFKNNEMARYGILSNGTFLSRENVARLKELKVDYVQVSIDGREKVNDQIRGEGVFRKAVKGLERLIEAGIKTSISFTVHKMNVKDIPLMIELARDMKVGTIGVRRLVPFGRGKGMRKLMLSPRQTKEVFEYLDVLREQVRDIYIVSGCEDGIAAQDMHHLPTGCLCGYHSLTLLPDGSVYPCRRLPILAGDLRKESLRDVFNNSQVLEDIRDINNIEKECRECPFFNECLGGAKCISYAYWGRLGGGDPQCWRRFDTLPDPAEKCVIPGKKKEFLTRF